MTSLYNKLPVKVREQVARFVRIFLLVLLPLVLALPNPLDVKALIAVVVASLDVAFHQWAKPLVDSLKGEQ